MNKYQSVKKFRMAQKVFLFNREGKVLVLRFSANEHIHKSLWGKWDFPGGGLKYDEVLEEGLLREIREELGEVKVKIGAPIMTWDWVQAGDETTRTVCVGYLGEFVSDKIDLNEEHDRYEWTSLAELANYDWMDSDFLAVLKLKKAMGISGVRKGEKCLHCGQRYSRDVAVDAVGVKNGKIALIKRSKPPGEGMWALPGGMLDWEESAEKAVVREFREETHLDGKLGKFVGVYSDPKRDDNERVAIVYAIAGVSGELKAGDDAADAKWFPLDKLPELAVDHKKMVEKYLKIRNKE